MFDLGVGGYRYTGAKNNESIDLNNFTNEHESYYMQGTTPLSSQNFPTGAGIGLLTVDRFYSDTNNVIQKYFDVINVQLYVRCYRQNIWTSWRQITTSIVQ